MAAVGICLAGREIRSASFALGVMQGLRAAVEPSGVEYLVAVSCGRSENLGLVELLRRGCRLVYCVDAGDDARLLAGALGRAITCACEELGVEIILDEPLGARLARTGVITGSITYPEPVAAGSGSRPIRFGTFVVVKATLDRDMRSGREEVDACREIGWELGARAAETGRRAAYGLPGVVSLRSYR